MNDRFKFRHWDKKINKMCYGDIYLSSSGKPFILHCETEKLLRPEDIDDVITMQCTGLKDKNGTLIYERDIVKNEENSVGHVEWEDAIGQYYVVFSIDMDLDFYSRNYEVIGNIYENPELLKSEE